MIYGYKTTDGVIQPMGASDTLERLTKALELAGIDSTDMKTQSTELVSVNGVYYLSADDEDYKNAKAAADAEAAKQAALPTDSDRLSAIEDAISELAEMLGGE